MICMFVFRFLDTKVWIFEHKHAPVYIRTFVSRFLDTNHH